MCPGPAIGTIIRFYSPYSDPYKQELLSSIQVPLIQVSPTQHRFVDEQSEPEKQLPEPSALPAQSVQRV